eukprot:gnl/TRDRNA2_/TRDRNA2_101916_c0_seq1.p1 gnl/TRDRNA2_/TRDRNA2_101916_c0~~gnl/TRDRNA2_/TRDRNA2_101916_c0_seq1.p1  ORF type:complete len:164 (-),score=17.47 gnl/TRDRNA2_/TRDRNA2_101916_c0_seq1:8-499(-)
MKSMKSTPNMDMTLRCGGLLDVVERCWTGCFASLSRRRNSHKLYIFHISSAAVCFLSCLGAILFYTLMWSKILHVNDTCELSYEMKTDFQLKNATRVQSSAIVCEGEGHVANACEVEQMRELLNTVLASGVVNGFQCFMSFTLAMSFRMFSHMPAEALQHQDI